MTGNVQSFDAERRGAALVVDDEPHVRAAMARGLAALGFAVLQAADAGQALALADSLRSSLELVFSDVMMPGMNGCELRREMMRAHSAKRYPTFQTVTICRGCSGSSSLRRSSAMCESTVRVMMNEP